MLFSLFLNDLVQFMSTTFQGLETIARCTIERLSDDDVEVYLHLCVPLYADDIVILAESHVDLQDALHALLGYPNMLGLQVNTANTKVTVGCFVNQNELYVRKAVFTTIVKSLK